MGKDRDAYNAYMRKYMLWRYHARRVESYAILGGKCVVCGITKDLEIDHIDPATKTISLSGLWSIARERYLKELELCQLLCGQHHRDKTSSEQSVPHGGGKSGKKNCYCELCAPLKRKCMRDYRAKKHGEHP